MIQLSTGYKWFVSFIYLFFNQEYCAEIYNIRYALTFVYAFLRNQVEKHM